MNYIMKILKYKIYSKQNFSILNENMQETFIKIEKAYCIKHPPNLTNGLDFVTVQYMLKYHVEITLSIYHSTIYAQRSRRKLSFSTSAVRPVLGHLLHDVLHNSQAVSKHGILNHVLMLLKVQILNLSSGF